MKPAAARLQGHRQWADAALLWQAAARGGAGATFDAGMKELASREGAGHVLVLAPR
jgi:hypothetical protein